MNENFSDLKRRITKIKKKGLIPIPRKGYGEVGLKFEQELGLNNNQFSVPDFYGIEIKVKNKSSSYPITMFSCTCDGPNMFELRRIVQKYGVTNFGTSKSLFITLSCNEYTKWGRYLKMKLCVDRVKEKVYIVISHANGKIIEKKAYWNFSTLADIMQRKMHYLCFVTYEVFFISGIKYAIFSDEYYLVYNDFSNFINLLERGDIVVNIKFGVHKKNQYLGKTYDHGTSFQVKRTALFDLFDQFLLKS